MANELKEVNKRIIAYRKLAGLTQADAARALGLNRSTYSRMERYGNPRPEMLIRLAELFNVSVEILLYGRAESKAETRREPEPLVIPAESATPLGLKEPVKPSLVPPPFVPTAVEINLIKAFRSLSKADKLEFRAFLDKLYHKNK